MYIAWCSVHTQKTYVFTESAKDQLSTVLDEMIFAPLSPSRIDMAIRDQMFSFTLLNSEPERGYTFHWNMHEIYSVHLEPFFSRITNVLLFDPHIDSQILHYGYIISQPPTDDIHVARADFASILKNYIHRDGDSFYVTNQELQTFVGGTDWNRVSSLMNDVAPIQFMVYIPPKQYSPLHVKHRDAKGAEHRNEYDAFLVPRFGGCTIYNPVEVVVNGNESDWNQSKKRKIKISTDDLYPTFNVVLSQMRSLLGLRNDHHYGDGVGGKGHSGEEVVFLMDRSGVSDWELDLLIRANIVRDLEAVEVAMKTIYEMIDAVEQLPIKRDVADLISDAVYALDHALDHSIANGPSSLSLHSQPLTAVVLLQHVSYHGHLIQCRAFPRSL